MKLVTKEIANRLAKDPIRSQEGKETNATIICKFFLASFTWYVLEAEKIGANDYEFFGVVDNAGRKEYGYFRLSELESLRVWGCLKVERDMYFKPQTIANCREFNS